MGFDENYLLKDLLWTYISDLYSVIAMGFVVLSYKFFAVEDFLWLNRFICSIQPYFSLSWILDFFLFYRYLKEFVCNSGVV